MYLSKNGSLILLMALVAISSGCISAWSDSNTPMSGPHDVDIEFVDEPPAYQNPADLLITVTADKDSSLQTNLTVEVPEGLEVVSGPQIFSVDIESGETVKKEITVQVREPGEYRILAKTADLRPDESVKLFGSDSVYFETEDRETESPYSVQGQNQS